MIARGDDEQFARLVQKIEPHSKLLRAWQLKGGVSAQVTALEIERPDRSSRKIVVRRHGARDFAYNPQIAADEFRLLQIVQSAGLPVPAPLYLDQSCTIFPTPYVVLEYVEGIAEYVPSDLEAVLRQLARHLADIHKIDGSQFDLSFLPEQKTLYSERIKEQPARMDDSLEEGRIRDALAAVCPLIQHNKPVLLHGDYWPGNIIWKDGRLSAIIDWEDAQFGDPLSDVSITRLDLLWASGIDAMHSFTQHYRSMTSLDFTNLPYWDLCAALRPAFNIAEWAGNKEKEKAWRIGHKEFVAHAFGNLPASKRK